MAMQRESSRDDEVRTDQQADSVTMVITLRLGFWLWSDMSQKTRTRTRPISKSTNISLLIKTKASRFQTPLSISPHRFIWVAGGPRLGGSSSRSESTSRPRCVVAFLSLLLGLILSGLR